MNGMIVSEQVFYGNEAWTIARRIERTFPFTSWPILLQSRGIVHLKTQDMKNGRETWRRMSEIAQNDAG
jgi:hypothetical protein